MQGKITIKGVDDRLEFYFSENFAYEDLREELIQLLKKNKNFFKSADVNVVVNGKLFSEVEIQEIKNIFISGYGINNVFFYNEYEDLKKTKQLLKNSLFGVSDSSCEQLKLVIAHKKDYVSFDDELIAAMQDDILSVIARYTNTEKEKIHFETVTDINKAASVSYFAADVVFADTDDFTE